MFPILGTIITVFLHLVSARNDSLSKNYQFPNQNLVLSDSSFDNKTLFYALYTQSSKHCSVVQEINPFTNYSVTKQCRFAIKADSVQLIVNFGTEKAVLITQEATLKSLKLKATTVHVANCKTVDAELVEVPLNWTDRKMYREHIDVVVSQQGFEVIIKGLSRLCTKPDAKIYCGVGFDVEGNKIEGPLIWPKMAYNEIDIISPVMADASGQGYFFVNRDSSLLAFQFNRKGGPKYVKLWYTPTQHSNTWREGYSVANKVDGMCYSLDSTIGCWQTDREGELKINMEFEFDPAFKANIKQCNTTQSSKIPESTTQVTTTQESTTQDTTTQSTTIQLATQEETTITEITTRETVASDTTTKGTTVEQTMTRGNTDDDAMEPITVQGITVGVVTTQNTTILDETTQDSTVAPTTTQENITEDIIIQNNTIHESIIEADTERNNNTAEDSATQEITTIDNTTLDIATEDNKMLANTTEYNTVQDNTVQGLITESYTTQETATQENTTTEIAISETTIQNVSLQDITVQGLTEQEHTTPTSSALKSLSQIKSTLEKHQVWNIFIHNLRNSGFIMFIITCPNRICSGVDDHYYLVKINALGKRVGQLEINVTSQCNPANGQVWAKVFENDRGQYCAVRLCAREAQLETLVNCYCNSDFK